MTAPVTPRDPAADNLRGMGLILVAMGVFILNDTMTKTASRELPTGEIIAIRGVISTAIMLPLVATRYRLTTLMTTYSTPLLIRNVAEVVAVILYLSALFRLPIANITALLQMLPLTMTAAAALFLGEKVGWRRWTAAGVGLVGVLLIVRPGSADFSWWYVPALVSLLFVTARDLATRFIPKETPTLFVTFLTAFVVTCAGFGLGLTETWVVPSLDALARLTAAAVLVLTGYYTLIEAWRVGEVSAIAPFRYSVVLWAIVFGYLFLGEVPDLWTLAGTGIVVAAGLYTFYRERQVASRRR